MGSRVRKVRRRGLKCTDRSARVLNIPYVLKNDILPFDFTLSFTIRLCHSTFPFDFAALLWPQEVEWELSHGSHSTS